MKTNIKFYIDQKIGYLPGQDGKPDQSWGQIIEIGQGEVEGEAFVLVMSPQFGRFGLVFNNKDLYFIEAKAVVELGHAQLLADRAAQPDSNDVTNCERCSS